MCDPLTIAAVASTAVGAVGSVGAASAQRSAQKKQANEVNQWRSEQAKFREQEQARQEEYRQKAEAAQQQGLEQISAENQKKMQSEEQDRLTQYLQGEGEASNTSDSSGKAVVSEADKAMLSGQDSGGEVFKTDLAKKIGEASTEAKKRIAALAKVSSYGDSFKGLGTENPLNQAATGSAIDRQNNFRRGSLAAYSRERSINPVEVNYSPSPMSGVFDAALSFGTQGIGNALGSAGKAGGSIWNSTSKAAAKADPWRGLRYGRNSTGMF